MEDIDDESDQDDGYKDVDEAADIRGVASLGQQEPEEMRFSQNQEAFENRWQKI